MTHATDKTHRPDRPALTGRPVKWNNSLVNRVRFRYNVSIAIAGLVAFIGAVPLATAGFADRSHAQPWYAFPLLLILIIPIAAIVWGWRAGTDATPAGIQVRPYGLGSRPIAWSEIVGIVPQNRRVYAILTDDRAVPLPGVSRAEIPRLIAASGKKISDDDATPVPEPADQ
jgi:hypothetical protein